MASSRPVDFEEEEARAPYQIRATPYESKSRSLLTNVRFSACACAINMRSNGSRCSPGKLPARSACPMEMPSGRKPICSSSRPNLPTMFSAPGSLPKRNFVEISQAETAETNTSFPKDSRAVCAFFESLLSPSIAQRRVCVSTRRRTIDPRHPVRRPGAARRTWR